MRVAGLTKDGDWIFGRGKASYKNKSLAIRQKVITRLQSFTNDWMLDIEHGNQWLLLFSNRSSETRILREIEASVLTTVGVKKIDKLKVESTELRDAKILLTYTDIYDIQLQAEASLL